MYTFRDSKFVGPCHPVLGVKARCDYRSELVAKLETHPAQPVLKGKNGRHGIVAARGEGHGTYPQGHPAAVQKLCFLRNRCGVEMIQSIHQLQQSELGCIAGHWIVVERAGKL